MLAQSPSSPPKPSLWSKTTAKVKKAASTIASGDPIARLTSTVEAQTLWPSSLEQESRQASLTLRGFFLDGFIVPYRTLAQCPGEVLRDCKGVAVFHILRAELQHPAAGGSGVVIAKKADGEWSSPSAISIRTDEAKGLVFPEGVDCLDVVCIINDFSGMKGFSDPHCRIGQDMTVAKGPMPTTGAGVSGFKMPAEEGRPDVWVYAKGKGHAVDVRLDGVVVRERVEENARFYGAEGLVAKEILGGRVQSPAGDSSELLKTLEVIKSRGSDFGGLPHGKSPGDCSVKKVQDTTTFGAWVNGTAGSAP